MNTFPTQFTKFTEFPKFNEIKFMVKCMSQKDDTKYFVIFVLLKHNLPHHQDRPYFSFLLDGETAVEYNDEWTIKDEFGEFHYPINLRFYDITECNIAIKRFINFPNFPHEYYPLRFTGC
jgi:hypothetical protein